MFTTHKNSVHKHISIRNFFFQTLIFVTFFFRVVRKGSGGFYPSNL